MDDRMTIANMAIEAGGKNGIFAADQKTFDLHQSPALAANGTKADYQPAEPGRDQKFVYDQVFDLSALEPTVAMHPNPGNRALAKTLGHITLDRAYIGSCTGGKLSDFLAFAEVVKGRKVAVDTFGVPATPQVVDELHKIQWGERSVWSILEDAGVLMTENAGCAACLGGPVDTFGRMNKPLTCISATNRNFPGRMGHKESKVYLASPYTVASSALTGRITDPAGISVNLRAVRRMARSVSGMENADRSARRMHGKGIVYCAAVWAVVGVALLAAAGTGCGLLHQGAATADNGAANVPDLTDPVKNSGPLQGQGGYDRAVFPLRPAAAQRLGPGPQEGHADHDAQPRDAASARSARWTGKPGYVGTEDITPTRPRNEIAAEDAQKLAAAAAVAPPPGALTSPGGQRPGRPGVYDPVRGRPLGKPAHPGCQPYSQAAAAVDLPILGRQKSKCRRQKSE